MTTISKKDPPRDVPRGILFLAAIVVVLIAAFCNLVRRPETPRRRLRHQTGLAISSKTSAAKTPRPSPHKRPPEPLIYIMSPSPSPSKGSTPPTPPLRARLIGSITNSGPSDVILAKATIAFYNDDPANPVDTREILLFNASDNSVRPDRPLSGSEVRPVDMFIEDVKPEWTTSNSSAAISEVWLSAPQTP